MVDRYCLTVVDDGTPLVNTTISDAFMASLNPTPRSVSWEQDERGISFKQDAYVEARGTILDNPELDPLPTNATDLRAIDQDGDGNPGMAVNVSILGVITGQTYVVQRVRYVLSGHLVSRIVSKERSNGQTRTSRCVGSLYSRHSRPGPGTRQIACVEKGKYVLPIRVFGSAH